MDLETVIGLEVHVQLNTATKLFCSCRAAFGREPNTLTCPVCSGQPGVLPALNRRAFHAAILAGLALECTIAEVTRFDRKNYFYPDLPKGYQITQYAAPIGTDGRIEFVTVGGAVRRAGITRVHLEEDAGKIVHPRSADHSLVDLNRAGIPLLEIVSEPVIDSPEAAHDFLAAVRRLMRYTGVSECDMEKGSLRCDANISVRPRGARELGTRTELKNLNSFRNVKRALRFERERQERILVKGGNVMHETRMWREREGVTASIRSKEETRDYGYFPEPDLPPFRVTVELLRGIRARIPEMPLARERRFRDAYGLTDYEAGVLTVDPATADFFEAVASACGEPRETACWIQGPVMREMNARGVAVGVLGLKPERLAALVSLVSEGGLSRLAAEKVFDRIVETDEDPRAAAAALGLEPISDPDRLSRIVDEVLAARADAVRHFRAGKRAALNAIVGGVMKATQGRADPAVIRELILRRLRE